MATQIERAESFKRLHIKGDPIILFNVWDAGTARVVADAGAKALATGSWSGGSSAWLRRWAGVISAAGNRKSCTHRRERIASGDN